MNKKISKIKRVFTLCLIFLLSINSFATSISNNDGSAFITKAEFDALKSSFQSQIDTYNQSIDSKIDEAIASYLNGVTIKYESVLINIQQDQIKQPIIFSSIWQRDSRKTYRMNFKGTGGGYDGGAVQQYKYFEIDTTDAYIPTADVTYDSTTFSKATADFGNKSRYVAIDEIANGGVNYDSYVGEYNSPYCYTATYTNGGHANNNGSHHTGQPILCYNSSAPTYTRGIPTMTTWGKTHTSGYQDSDYNKSKMDTDDWKTWEGMLEQEDIGHSWDTRYTSMKFVSYANRIDTKVDGAITDMGNYQLDGKLSLSSTAKWDCLSKQWVNADYKTKPLWGGMELQGKLANVIISFQGTSGSGSFNWKPHIIVQCHYFYPPYQNLNATSLYNSLITKLTDYPVKLTGGVPLAKPLYTGKMEFFAKVRGSETNPGKIYIAFKEDTPFGNDDTFAGSLDVEAWDCDSAGNITGGYSKAKVITIDADGTGTYYKSFKVPTSADKVIYYKMAYVDATGTSWTRNKDNQADNANCYIESFGEIVNTKSYD